MEARKAVQEGKGKGTRTPPDVYGSGGLLDYIKVGCKLVWQAGLELLKFGKGCNDFMIFNGIYDSL